MVADELIQIKLYYNAYLKRYIAGCNYLNEHPEKTDKYLKNVIDFRDKADSMLNLLKKRGYEPTHEEIAMGFK